MKTHKKSANFRCFRQAVVALAVLLATACATVTEKSAPTTAEIVGERLDSYVLQQGDIRHDINNKDVAKLWQESEIMRRNGDIENAKARLQKAIEITPRDAVLWSRAAEFELDQNAFLRAENYAAKSNYLATLGNRELRYRNWLIIKRSREGRGDLLGAREAELETSQLIER